MDDVVVAVSRARELQLPVSIRGGGHGVAGHCVADGAVAIDLSGRRRVDVDPTAQTAAAQGGATWEDYDTATQRFGLASTGGTFVDTGIAGLTLGGGIGYLEGTQGFAVDTLIGATVVTADAEIVHASGAENPELFWALRGAGANFGVVTDFEYRLQPVGQLYGGMIEYPMSRAADALRAARDLAGGAPDQLVLQCVLGRRSSTATVTNPLLPFGLRHYWKGHFLRDLPDELIDESVDHLEQRPSSGFGTLLIEFIDGAPLRVPADSMAFNQRNARVNASALAIWANPAADDLHVAWARDFGVKLAPHAVGAEYINYMAVDVPPDRVRAAYGDVKYARLRDLKRRYDPTNIFRSNQNIPPATVATDA